MIQADRIQSQMDAKVMDVQLVLKSDIAAFGQVVFGSITLRAHMRTIHPGNMQARNDQNFELHVWSEGQTSTGSIIWWFVQDVTDEPLEHADGTVTLIVIWTGLPPTSGNDIEGLVVKPVVSNRSGIITRSSWFRSKPDAFRRVGYFRTTRAVAGLDRFKERVVVLV